MLKRAFSLGLILSYLLGATPGWCAPFWRRTQDRLVISGSKTYGLQALSVSGNRNVFYGDNYTYSGQYRNQTNLSVIGNLLPHLSVAATLSSNRYDRYSQAMTVNYDGGRTKASMGDITASMTGNELIPFSKRLRGATITQDFGVAKVMAIASQTRASSKSKSFPGNNTPGPYYLDVSQITDSSEHVRIDNQDIARVDSSTGLPNYTLDAMAGVLTFRDGLIVPTTSVISVSFDSQSYNSSTGRIWGMRTDVPVGRQGGLGFTYLTQQSDSGQVALRPLSEKFYGNNSLNEPYRLSYIPLQSPPLVVRIDGFEDHSCSINYAHGYVMFDRPIPSTSIVEVAYVPTPDTAVAGNRSVMGIDGKVKVSEHLTLSGQFARSAQDYTGQGGGSASALRAAGKFGRLEYVANLRSIAPSFAPLENAGFFQNEQGGDLDLKYNLSSQLSFFSRLLRYKKPNYQGTGLTAGPLVNTIQTVQGFEWKPAKRPQLRFMHTSQDSGNGTDSKYSLSTDAIVMNWDRGKFGTTAEVNRSNRAGIYMTGTGVLTPNSGSSQTSRLSFRYMPGQRLSLNADMSGSKVTNSSASGSNNNAKNYQMSANFMAARNLNLSASYRVSDSGGLFTTSVSDYPGVTTGAGIGTGYPGGQTILSYGLKSVTRSLGMSWTPSTKFSIDSSYNYSYSAGGDSTNTTLNGLDFGFSLSPANVVSLRAHISHQNGGFIESGGDMSSKIGFATLSLGPVRRFTLDANYQKMLSGSLGTLVNTESFGANLRRDIGGGRFLFTEFVSSSFSGFTTNSKKSLAFGIEYPLNEVLGLKVDWRIIDYIDALSSSNNYHASMINAQIGARFR